jgi:hypothetical protein
MNIQDFIGDVNLEESAGLEVEVAFADKRDIQTFPDLPDLAASGATNVDYVDLGSEVFVMKTGKKFHKFESSLEKNAYQAELVGSRGALTWQHTLTIAKNSVTKALMGWLRANRNRPLIVAFRFLGETQWTVIGFEKAHAEVQGANINVAAEVAGEKMTSVQIRAIYYPPLYIDAIPFTPAA